MRLIDADAIKDPYEGTSLAGGWVSKLFEMMIMNAPTIDTVKHGHWEKVSPINYKCSICNAWWCDDYYFMENFIFCPSCGAKMDEVSE